METEICQKKQKLSSKGYFLAKKIGRAIGEYKMIQDGDRVLVGVSGGKDSLTLLTILHERKKWLPIDYEILAVHVQTDYKCKNCTHLDTLKKFFEERGYSYVIDNIEILKNPDGTKNEISCFWCSWNRRKSLFKMAEKYKCNKVAFGHHKDDMAQTMLLNLFYHAEISTMAPKVSMFNGELDIIRPLAYVEEKDIVSYSKEQEFPSHLCACPHGQRSQRRQMKDILNNLEKICPHVKNNVIRSMKRVKKDYLV